MGELNPRKAILVALCFLGCVEAPRTTVYSWNLPQGFPEPRVPEDNPMSAAKVELGRHLFFDTRLSENRMQSCGSCHEQDRAFTDGRAVSIGSTGDSTPRGAMSITNSVYNFTQTWANPALTRLEDQALVPLFGEHPIELGLAGREEQLVTRLRTEDPRYLTLFRNAFPENSEPFTLNNAVRAIASFERSLLSGNSPVDRFLNRGETQALSESAQRGLTLFNSERLECFHCHGGFNFSGEVNHARNLLAEQQYQNNGLYNIDGRGGYPAPNRGLFESTHDPRDMGRFKPPTLRNIEMSAPYMHDGSLATLEDVIAHYARGGREILSGPNAGDGHESPVKSTFLHGFTLSESEQADLLAFLRALTDQEFLHDRRFASPW